MGGFTAIFDLTFFFIFAHLLEFNYLVVSASGFLVAVLINYCLSIRFVFESGSRFGSRRYELGLVYLASTVGLILHQWVLYGIYEHIYPHLMAAKIVATAAVFGWNFLIRLFYIFKEQ